jgi:hypothetical protein
MGAAYSRYKLLTNKNFKEDDIAILVDMDDYLKPNALYYIDNIYKNKNIELTYGNWISDAGQKHTPTRFSDEIIKNNKFEDDGPWATHLRTFKIKLLKNICPFYFQIDNKWIKNSTDVALMTFVLKNVKNKDGIFVVDEPIYVYRRGVENATIKRFPRLNKIEISRVIRQKIRENFKNGELTYFNS